MSNTPARQAVYAGLMWPGWNPTSESHGTGYDKAIELLDAYRAEVLAEAAAKQREDAALREIEGETELAEYGRELADLIQPQLAD